MRLTEPECIPRVFSLAGGIRNAMSIRNLCRARAIAFFKMGIGCHGFGVLDKAVPIEHSHGLTADGKTVAPHLKKGDGPACAASRWWS